MGHRRDNRGGGGAGTLGVIGGTIGEGLGVWDMGGTIREREGLGHWEGLDIGGGVGHGRDNRGVGGGGLGH